LPHPCTLYLDSSALVKLVQAERESAALRRYLHRHQSLVRATCALARVEVVQAVADADGMLSAARNWTVLVEHCGWTPERYERWMTDIITRQFFRQIQ
jgi:uncharacterized protein with PIN domain